MSHGKLSILFHLIQTLTIFSRELIMELIIPFLGGSWKIRLQLKESMFLARYQIIAHFLLDCGLIVIIGMCFITRYRPLIMLTMHPI